MYSNTHYIHVIIIKRRWCEGHRALDRETISMARVNKYMCLNVINVETFTIRHCLQLGWYFGLLKGLIRPQHSITGTASPAFIVSLYLL